MQNLPTPRPFTDHLQSFPEAEYGPWFTVGRHLHFQDHVVQLAKGVVRNLLGLGSKADLPDFVSMHIRRGDFLESCPEESKPWCVASDFTLLEELCFLN